MIQSTGFRSLSGLSAARLQRVASGKRYREKPLVTALALLALTGCSGADAQPNEFCKVAEEDLYRTGALWPTGFTLTRVVRVCFSAQAMAHPQFTNVRNNIRRAFNRTWGAVANIYYTDVGSCGASANGMVEVTILNDPLGGTPNFGNADVGYQGAGAKTVLNIGWGASQGTIAHEFGHILGFPHEMTRPDFIDDPAAAPGNCHEDNTNGGDYLGTPANDRFSIMSHGIYCGWQSEDLGAWDIVGVQKAYGRKPFGSIVGLENSCLEVPNDDYTPGNDLKTWNCFGGPRQMWSRNTSYNLFNRSAPAGGGGYVEVQGGSSADWTPVQIVAQNVPVTNKQKWGFENTQLMAMGNKCVEVPNSNFANWQQLQINTCNGGANQKWTFEPDGRVRNGSWCMDVKNGSTATGTPIQLFACHGGWQQKFRFLTSGIIRFLDGVADPPMCVDVTGGTVNNGTPLQLYPCHNGPPQQFHFRGEIRSLGKCLDIFNGVPANGAPAIMYQCHGQPNEIWDYYWYP